MDEEYDAENYWDPGDNQQRERDWDLWLTRYLEAGAGPHWHQDDLEAAFKAGYSKASTYRWE